MIVAISIEKMNEIEKLENNFASFFSKNNKVISDMEKNSFSRYFIYCEESNIIGFVNYYDLYDRFEIAHIEVLEKYRNKKIGSKLVEYLINLGYEKSIENITLEVNVNNSFAIKLYKKYNFETVAIRKKYYNGIDGLLMERKMM